MLLRLILIIQFLRMPFLQSSIRPVASESMAIRRILPRKKNLVQWRFVYYISSVVCLSLRYFTLLFFSTHSLVSFRPWMRSVIVYTCTQLFLMLSRGKITIFSSFSLCVELKFFAVDGLVWLRACEQSTSVFDRRHLLFAARALRKGMDIGASVNSNLVIISKVSSLNIMNNWTLLGQIMKCVNYVDLKF